MSQTGLGWGMLADLAFDDESDARLRDTVQVFPRAGRYTATAERRSLHKNGVQYCIRKAEESLRGRIDDCRADPRACPVSLPISWPCGTSAIGLRIGSGGLALDRTTVSMCVLIIFTTERRTNVR